MMRHRFVCAILIFCILVPVQAENEMNSLNEALKKELGIGASQNSSQVDPSSASTSKEKISTDTQEADPVRDRYSEGESGGSAIVLLVKVLLVFGGLTFVMIYILKVMSRTRNARYPVQGRMTLLSSLPIGTNKQVQIVEVADKLLVLGVGESSVSLLTEITDIDMKARILKEKEEFVPGGENFLVTLLESLKDLKPGSSGKTHFASATEDWSELEKRHEESLRRLQASKKELGLDSGGGL